MNGHSKLYRTDCKRPGGVCVALHALKQKKSLAGTKQSPTPPAPGARDRVGACGEEKSGKHGKVMWSRFQISHSF